MNHRCTMPTLPTDDMESAVGIVRPILLKFAKIILGNRENAEDAVQDALVELMRVKDRLPPDLSLSVILFRLTRQRALMQRRSAHRRSLREVSWESVRVMSLTEPEETIPDLPVLTEKQREILASFAVDDGIENVAARIGTTPGNARVLLHRIRNSLGARRKSSQFHRLTTYTGM